MVIWVEGYVILINSNDKIPTETIKHQNVREALQDDNDSLMFQFSDQNIVFAFVIPNCPALVDSYLRFFSQKKPEVKICTSWIWGVVVVALKSKCIFGMLCKNSSREHLTSVDRWGKAKLLVKYTQSYN